MSKSGKSYLNNDANAPWCPFPSACNQNNGYYPATSFCANGVEETHSPLAGIGVTCYKCSESSSSSSSGGGSLCLEGVDGELSGDCVTEFDKTPIIDDKIYGDSAEIIN